MLAMCKRDVRPAPTPNSGPSWIERDPQTLGAKQASSEDQRVQQLERGRLYKRMPLMRLGQYLRTVATGSGALRALFYEQNIETQEVEKEAEALYDEYDWFDVGLPMACQRKNRAHPREHASERHMLSGTNQMLKFFREQFVRERFLFHRTSTRDAATFQSRSCRVGCVVQTNVLRQ